MFFTDLFGNIHDPLPPQFEIKPDQNNYEVTGPIQPSPMPSPQPIDPGFAMPFNPDLFDQSDDFNDDNAAENFGFGPSPQPAFGAY